MTPTFIPWDHGAWTVQPRAIHHDGEHLVVEAVEGSDYWRDTLYSFRHENGHALLAPWDADHAVEVGFRLAGFSGLYDQAGLMLWRDASRWIKAGIEINDGEPCLAVVVTGEHSDWSLSPVPDWVDRVVTMRASRLNDAVIVRARVDAEPWRTLRVAPFDHSDAQAGPFLCAPTRAGFRVTFTRWASTPPDTELHVDPP